MSSDRPPLVEFREVSKRFGDSSLVLDRLSFSVEEGEFVTFIGPSGCGKSTLLRLIAGLTPVSSGDLVIRPGAGGPSLEQAFVFQDPRLLPWLTAERNVEVPLRLRGVPRAERRALAATHLERVGLRTRGDAYPRQLSGGQRMRVSLARALVLSPRLLLLDEPFGALDELTRDHLNEELLGLRQQEGWTAFFVTHSVGEAVFLSNRIFVLGANPGHVHQEVRVPFPYPRTEYPRQSPEYLQLVAEVSRLLRSVERGPT